MTIKWYVVEFDSGVTVQRGFTNITGNDVTDVPLLAAVDLAKSFPLISYRVEGTFFNCNDFVRAKITSTTNLQLSTDNTNCGAPASVVKWQVVEYADANVRSGDIAFATTDLCPDRHSGPAGKSREVLAHLFLRGDPQRE